MDVFNFIKSIYDFINSLIRILEKLIPFLETHLIKSDLYYELDSLLEILKNIPK